MTRLDDGALAGLRRALAEPDLTGTRYELRGELGRGGTATVYRANDRLLEREVALKVLDLPEADPTFGERVLREARILAGLEHPGIVPVHDAGTLPDGRVYCAMKQVRGERLDIAALALALHEKLRLFLRVCEAVSFAHAHGVVHRDLKPENVMVGPFGEVLVLDWGLARRLDSATWEPESLAGRVGRPVTRGAGRLTGEGDVLGTPAYMAPEQERGGAMAAGPASDVFALGGVLEFLLTGRPPVREAAARLQAPKPLLAIRDRALAERPGDRYDSAAALAAEIERFLDGRPVEAYRESPAERALRFFVRYRGAILLVAAYLLARILLLLFSRGAGQGGG